LRGRCAAGDLAAFVQPANSYASGGDDLEPMPEAPISPSGCLQCSILGFLDFETRDLFAGGASKRGRPVRETIGNPPASDATLRERFGCGSCVGLHATIRKNPLRMIGNPLFRQRF